MFGFRWPTLLREFVWRRISNDQNSFRISKVPQEKRKTSGFPWITSKILNQFRELTADSLQTNPLKSFSVRFLIIIENQQFFRKKPYFQVISSKSNLRGSGSGWGSSIECFGTAQCWSNTDLRRSSVARIRASASTRLVSSGADAPSTLLGSSARLRSSSSFSGLLSSAVVSWVSLCHRISFQVGCFPKILVWNYCVCREISLQVADLKHFEFPRKCIIIILWNAKLIDSTFGSYRTKNKPSRTYKFINSAISRSD